MRTLEAIPAWTIHAFAFAMKYSLTLEPDDHLGHNVPPRSPRMGKATVQSVNVAEAKRRLSDLLGRVAYGGETVVITRRGRPMAKLVPPGEAGEGQGLGAVHGWLEEDDPFFAAVDAIVAARARHRPRAYSRRRGVR
jgi:prevent-host-death family protein